MVDKIRIFLKDKAVRIPFEVNVGLRGFSQPVSERSPWFCAVPVKYVASVASLK
jgi:hypothetical protein